MKLTKAATRPIIVIELASAWIAMLLLGIEPTTAFELAAGGSIAWYFADRTITHRLGEKDCVAPEKP
jgi:hypothetical protein